MSKDSFEIAILAGDGIGTEVTDATFAAAKVASVTSVPMPSPARIAISKLSFDI